MHSSIAILAAILASGAVASPIKRQENRFTGDPGSGFAHPTGGLSIEWVRHTDWVTDFDIVTDVVTVGGPAPTILPTTFVKPTSASGAPFSVGAHDLTTVSPSGTSFRPVSTGSHPSGTAATSITGNVNVAPTPSVAHIGHSGRISSSLSLPTVPSSTSAKSTLTSTKASPTSVAASSSAVPSHSPSTGSSPSAKPTTYSEITVAHHNFHRANHSSPDIVWDNGLAGIAADIAATCNYQHNVTAGGGGYGQNIAAGVKPDNISAIITDLFYNGEVNYYNGLYGASQPDMTNFEHWGHFSQVVWKSTTKVGCATHDCSSKGLAQTGSNVAPYFTVCNYGTPGNYANEYGANVLASLKKPTIGWNYGL